MRSKHLKAEAHQKEREYLLINKVLSLIDDNVYICLIDPITEKEKLKLGYYENLRQEGMKSIEHQLLSGIEFILSLSVSFLLFPSMDGKNSSLNL